MQVCTLESCGGEELNKSDLFFYFCFAVVAITGIYLVLTSPLDSSKDDIRIGGAVGVLAIMLGIGGVITIYSFRDDSKSEIKH